ncbi:MAG: hypothetical protein EOM30_03275 [Clostridia bacterium]|nr:hypothetical protein [Clostridia bacterium]NLS85587.1 hypothetical protein [Oscillospiraceae bacterium]
MALLKGITITLYDKVQTGTDAFNAPIYAEKPIIVRNVLVSPVSSDDIVDATQLNGKKSVYELCIPKSDKHIWEDMTLEFFGEKWRTFGFSTSYIENLLPLAWNKKIKVVRYE